MVARNARQGIARIRTLCQPLADGSCGWRAWLNNTTITLGMNNVFDQDPPFVAGNDENGYDQWQANIRGRTWYVALTKRF